MILFQDYMHENEKIDYKINQLLIVIQLHKCVLKKKKKKQQL